MSELSFEYKCINFLQKNNEQALKFYLYQEYGKNGFISIRVYIPKDKQVDLEYVDLYFNENGVNFPDFINKAPTKQFKAIEVKNENSIQINVSSKMELNGVGVIIFKYKNDNKRIQERNIYRFAINYCRKEIISYVINERRKSIKIQVLFPRILKEIDLIVARKEGSKPLLISDMKNTLNSDKDLIRLIPSGREFDIKEKVIKKGIKPDIEDYRLTFKDPKDNKFYLLVDESKKTLEDIKLKTSKQKKKPIYRCIYCGNILNKKLFAKKGTFSCDNKRIDNLAQNEYNLDILCTENTWIQENNRSLENCLLMLPKNILKKPCMNIVVAGHQKSGKTIYLASLIDMSIDSVSENQYNCSAPTLDMIVKTFDKSKNNSVKEIVNKTFYDKKFEKKFTDNSIYTDMSRGRYNISVNSQIESQTLADKSELLSWNPIHFEMGNLGFINLYDVPGEIFSPSSVEKNRAFDIADGIMLIVDGDVRNSTSSIRQVNPFIVATNSLKQIAKIGTDSAKNFSDIPLAIVFTKLDLKLKEYTPKIDAASINECFDENDNIAREDIISLLPKNGIYKGSELEKHIELSSYELEHYLKSANDETKKAYKDLLHDYNNVKFFAISALGNDNFLQNINNQSNPTVLCKPKRIRIELPIIWLMYQNKLIKR